MIYESYRFRVCHFRRFTCVFIFKYLQVIVEIFISLGFIFGPQIGGYLFLFGDFKYPFLLAGTGQLLLCPLLYWKIPTIESNFNRNISFANVIIFNIF